MLGPVYNGPVDRVLFTAQRGGGKLPIVPWQYKYHQKYFNYKFISRPCIVIVSFILSLSWI